MAIAAGASKKKEKKVFILDLTENEIGSMGR